MIFDGNLSIMSLEAHGKDVHGENLVHLVLQPAVALPVGPGQIMPLPVANLRIPLTKKIALEKAEELKRAAETLEDEVDLGDFTIAPNMTGVDKIAQTDKKIRGKK